MAVTLKARDLGRGMVMDIRISGMRAFTFRVWIATQLIKLACVVFPFHVNMTTNAIEED